MSKWYRKYYADVDALAKRHSAESPERVKEMIDKLIKNLGKTQNINYRE